MSEQRQGYDGPLLVSYEPDSDCSCRGTGRHNGNVSCGAWVINPTEPTVAELADMLRANARGDEPWEAAVELLIAHGHWLRVAQFRRVVDCFLGYGGPTSVVPDTPHAQIDWTAVGEALGAPSFPASGSELAVLRIAASLASRYVPVNLRDALAGLDRTNSRLVTTAVAHAAGVDMP